MFTLQYICTIMQIDTYKDYADNALHLFTPWFNHHTLGCRVILYNRNNAYEINVYINE